MPIFAGYSSLVITCSSSPVPCWLPAVSVRAH